MKKGLVPIGLRKLYFEFYFASLISQK